MLEQLSTEAEAFFRELLEEHYYNLSGLKPELSLQPIYTRHAKLFSLQTVTAFLAPDLDPKDREAVYFREFAVEGYLENRTKELSEEILNKETQATVPWDGRDIPLRAVSKEIAAEADLTRRHQLDEARRRVNSSINPVRKARWQTLYATVGELGFGNYGQAMDQLKGLQLNWLRTASSGFLTDTLDLYRTRLQTYLKEIGVGPNEATRADLAHLFRAPQYDVLFPKERLITTLESTVAGMGLHLRSQPNIALDTEPRPLKSPRAFCAPIEVPNRIMLVINPQGGQDDYQALLHEAGHAEHFAHTDPSLPFAFRRLGDNSVTETFAFLFHYLTIDPGWIVTYLSDGEAAKDYVEFAKFVKLYMLRRYAAKLIYEMEMHFSHGLEEAPSRYAEILSTHLLVRHFPEDFLTDLDDGFYSAQYLRAWILEAQVRSWLRGKHGRHWWADEQTGHDLVLLWQQGQRYSAPEVARSLGLDPLDLRPLLNDLI